MLARLVRSVAVAGTMIVVGAAPSEAATLTIGNGADPGTLDPHRAGGDWEDRVISELLEGLVIEGPEATAVPGQALSWTISPDGLVYTFKLRPDARWSDGQPVVAQHFVDGFQRLFDPETAAEYAYLQFPILNGERRLAGALSDPEAIGVSALDPLTLQITLEGPTPYFLEALTHLTAMPIREDLIERWGDDWTKPGNMVGNGAYRLVEWVPGAQIRAVKSETYYDAEKVSIEEVRWVNSQDLASAFLRYRAGEIDILTEFPADQHGFLEQMHPGEAHVHPYLGIRYLVVNHEKAPFDDPRVREALSISLMRESFGTDILGSGELPAFGWVPPGVTHYSGNQYRPVWADEPLPARTERARALLADAGYDDAHPLKFRLRYLANETQRLIAVAVAAMWDAIGVETELYVSESAAHWDALEAGDFEVAAAGWLMDYNDAINTLDLLRGPIVDLNNVTFWGNNFGRYRSAALDELLDRASKELDQAERANLLKQAEEMAMEAFAAIPLYWTVSRVAVSPRVRGYVDNVENIHRLRWLSLAD